MKKTFLTMFLLTLMGMAGNLTATAQTPEPSGQWKFDDPSDLMAATVGNATLTPATIGSASIAEATVSEAGITAANGPKEENAILVPKASALKVQRAEGAAASSTFSFMIDLKVPNAYAYDGLFQTNLNNTNDGDLFISKGQIGAGAMGGYVGCIWNDMWYRVVFTNTGSAIKVFVNGKKVIDYATTETRWEIDPYFYLLCDEDGEKSDTYVSEVAFWETPLTDEQVAELGSADNLPWITDASQIKEGDEFFIISDRAKFKGSTTAYPKAMAPIQPGFSVNWGEQYVYWGDLDKESEGFIWTAEKAGDQWAFLNKENGKYLGNMNTGESDVIFSDTPVGYTLTDLTDGAGKFYMTNDESEYSLHVQGYLRSDRGNNSLSKQNVGNDDYADANSVNDGYPGRWRLLKLNADEPEPIDTRTKIASAEDFAAFAQAVNEGNTELEAVLTADIDLTETPVMVGNSANAFAGTFDGAGYTITYNYPEVGNYGGLFSYVNGATIRNLYVKGTAIVQGIHYGALMGYVAGDVLVENVVTDVDITGDRTSVTGDAGMIGYLDGPVTFNNCATLGKMGKTGTSMYCGFVAFASGNGSSILNSCFTTCSLTEGTGTDYCFTFCRGAVQLNNCYYLNVIGTEQGKAITEDKIASGEFCYLLNGDQSTIGWYQTLGQDAQPVPFSTHEQVYANGELRCDGNAVEGGTLTYSNSSTSEIPPHNYADGWCSVCGKLDVNYLTADNDGFFNIATAKDLAWISEYIAQGNQTINVKLTADINLSESEYPDLMIATEGRPFGGIFEGAEHTITYNYANVTEKWRGLFRAAKDATIRNLRVEGSAYVTNIHFGALIGVAYGTVLVENVVTNVNIAGNSGVGVTGDAGMLGANYAQITFNNCATLGEMGYEGSSMYSSYSGWSDGASSTTLNNCYTTCKLTEGTGTGNCFTLTHGSGTNTFNNCYYLNTVGTVQGTQMTGEQLASGELCFKLNGDQSTIGWYQTLPDDAQPVPFSSHKQVYANGTVRCDGAEIPDSPITYSNTEGQTSKPSHQYGEDGFCTICGSLKQNADGYYVIDTAQKLNWIATKANEGTKELNVLLAADIDLSTSDYPDLMIGAENNGYNGIFDGAGHTITYNYAEVSSKWRGLFAFVNGATIRNLKVEGSAVVTNIHYGALIGRADGTVLVENVITNVGITGMRSGVTGDGGMLGANYAQITFNNCATLGKMGYEGSSMYSSFSAWSSGSSSTTLNNCFTICELTEGTGTGNCFTLTHAGGTNTINNCYYLNEIGVVQGSPVTAEEVANGSLAAKLGNGWYQNIGEDAYPVLDKTHAVVKEISEAGYATMYIPTAVEIPEGVTANTGSFKTEEGVTTLNLNPIEEVVPGWEPVVLKGAPGFYGFKPAAGTEKTTDIVFADLNLVDTEVIPETEVEGLTFNFASGTNTNAPKYYANGSAIRIYASNSMTISAAAPITKIEFTFVNNYAFQSGGFELSDGTYALATTTWTGSAESITFTNTSTKQWRIVSMKVTYTGSPANIAGNVLKGAAEDIEATGKYILAKPEDKQVGFYLAETGIIKAGKAYLELPEASDIKAFYFTEDDATAIKTMDNSQQTTDGPIFNLAGQRINKMQRGINIVNGKKILK